MSESEIKRARQIFHNKKSNPDFIYFKEKGIDYFVSWFTSLEQKCCYCCIEEYKLRKLFESGRLSTKRKRGRSLELERIDSNSNLYTEENCKLACYFCNNHKSDIITKEEHLKYFAAPINQYLNDIYGSGDKIIDYDTNFLYLSDKLKTKYPQFAKYFISILEKENINFDFLPNTNDVWAVDYMPIQTLKNKFIQFKYSPDYLRNYKKWKPTITDTDSVCEQIGINPINSDIIIDGGNIIKSRTKVILTSKIFKENPQYSEIELVEEIERLLELKVLIIPLEQKDWIGHADGTVRFLDEHSVLINDCGKENDLYFTELKMALRNAGLNYLEIPFNPYENKSNDDASGLYINYLQMENKIFLPVFGLRSDDIAVKRFEELFKNTDIIPVKSNDIAEDGGVLNCISWNIKA